jgi:P2-related tail formation protein
MVYLVDIVDSSALPWLGEQFSLFGDGWELAEWTMLPHAYQIRYRAAPLKGRQWSIREIIRRFWLRRSGSD